MHHFFNGLAPDLCLCSGGGADGSVLVFPAVEPSYLANDGIGDSVNNLLPFLSLFPTIFAGDLVQYAAAVVISNCPVSIHSSHQALLRSC